jgi:hypothetical protein
LQIKKSKERTALYGQKLLPRTFIFVKADEGGGPPPAWAVVSLLKDY